ncbi:MAG: ATP-binding protein [Calditrichaeota bacterium]|nr:ATP-binding protein [Calditrichota bacterium]
MIDEPQRTVELSIPMLKDMELAAAKVAEGLSSLMDFDEAKRAEVTMALLEACINSFEHSKSADRRVYIHFHMGKDHLRIILRDRGVGFDRSSVELPDISKKLQKGARKRGWGLMLMESLMDEVYFASDEEGSTLTMIKWK